MQDCISQLCEAAAQGKVNEGYIPRYMELMAGATDQGPRLPDVFSLSYGALVATCVALKVQPPNHLSRQEMEFARHRLAGLKGQGQFELSKLLCNLAQADLVWLGTQPVLGAGSIVLHGAAIQMPAVILRPEVSHNYSSATKTLDRELDYRTTDLKFLKSSAIADTLAKTKWPMGQVPVHFAWDGPDSPFYLPAAEMRLQAEKWGIKVEATTSHQRLQPLVVAKAATEYEQQFKAAVDAAWQAACAAAKQDEGREEAAPVEVPSPSITPTESFEPDHKAQMAVPPAEPLRVPDFSQPITPTEPPTPSDDQPTTTTGSASMAEPTKAGEQPMTEPTPAVEQPKEAEAQPSASSQGELSTPKPLDNPALAGVPVKPRCKQCNCMLDKDLCVGPDCSMFLVEPAMEDGQPVEAESTKKVDQPMEAEPTKADDSAMETEPTRGGEQAMEAEPPKAGEQPMAEQPMAKPTKADEPAEDAQPAKEAEQLMKAKPTEDDLRAQAEAVANYAAASAWKAAAAVAKAKATFASRSSPRLAGRKRPAEKQAPKPALPPHVLAAMAREPPVIMR